MKSTNYFTVIAGLLASCGTESGSAPPPPEVHDADHVAAAAVFAGSCLNDPILEWLARAHLVRGVDYYGLDGGVVCLATAADGCAAAERCLDVDFAIDPECQEGCVDDQMTACGSAGQRLDLACPTGWSCDPGVESCVPDVAASCDDDFEERCDEGRPVRCVRGIEHVGTACSAYGLVCEVSVNRGVQCVGEGEACSGLYSDWFENTWMVGTCVDDATLSTCANQKAHLQACSDVHPDFRCQTIGDWSYCGLGSDCVPHFYEDAPTCEGTVLSVCNAGRLELVDCTALGFTGCVSKGPDGYICAPGPFD